MLETLKAAFHLPTWSILLLLMFAGFSVASGVAGFIVQRNQEATLAVAEASRADIAESNRHLVEHLFGSSLSDVNGRLWILRSAELKRYERLDLALWPQLQSERDTLLKRLNSLPSSLSGREFDVVLPRNLHDDFIQFQDRALAAK